ncbi:MAG: metallophosphoesterase [Deltaproteobacteria bacterium]|nr:metallophosphoesterase [Deltaproteobacteria bacterium]
MHTVAISDPHLGQNGEDGRGQYSLLSTRAPLSRAAALAHRLERLPAGDVTLVVAGDLLDLSLAFMRDGVEDLVDLLAALPRVTGLVWVVGNHDHHVWTLHEEELRTLAPLRRGELPGDGCTYRATAPSAEPFTLLSEIVRQRLAARRIDLRIAYPTFEIALRDPRLPDGSGPTLFHFTHGHLFGGLYTTLSDVLEAQLSGRPYERVAATVNGPLIELIYWLLGEIGEGFGADGLMEVIYTDMQKGQDARVRRLIDQAVGKLFPEGVVTGIPDALEREAISCAVKGALERAVAKENAMSKSSDRHAGVDETREHLASWIEKTKLFARPAAPIRHVVYGHTHTADMYSVPGKNVTSYNLGSWLVEPGHEDPDSQVLVVSEGPDRLDITWDKIA